MKTYVLIIISMIVIGCGQPINETENKSDNDNDTSKLANSYANNKKWVIIKYSGEVITDIYKITKAKSGAEREEVYWGDVCLKFVDSKGYPISLNYGSYIKVIEMPLNDNVMFNKFIEYHMEWDSLSYKERYKEFIAKKK